MNPRKNTMEPQIILKKKSRIRYSVNKMPSLLATIVITTLAASAPALKAQSFYVDSGEYSSNYLIFTVTSSGAVNYFSDANPPAELHPGYLGGLAVDSSYNLYVASGYSASGGEAGEIDEITPAGVASVYATLPLNSDPEGLAFYGSNLFVAEAGGHIGEIAPNGAVSVYATLSGSSGSGPLNIQDLAFDGNGDLFVDTYSMGPHKASTIYEITTGGAVSTFATLAPGDGLLGMAFDASGNLYVDGEFDDQVNEITPNGTVSLFATLPSGSLPFGMTYSDGNLYVAESNNSTIAQITPDGTVSTFATGVSAAPLYIIDPPLGAVPEPSTWWEMMLGFVGILVWAKRSGQRPALNANRSPLTMDF